MDLLSRQSISEFIFVSYIFMSFTLIAGIFSILVIFRYSTKSMAANYKNHLLNIAITILLSDLCFQFFCRPYVLFPIVGVCMVGSIETAFDQYVDKDVIMRIASFLQVFATTSSLAAVSNATIHRYVITIRLINPLPNVFTQKYFLVGIMVVLQFLWPLVGCILCLNLQLHSEMAIRENSVIDAHTVAQSQLHSCFIASTNVWNALYTVRVTTVISVNGGLCAFGSMVLVILCWRKLKLAQVQQSTVSQRTIALEKQLMFSLGVQAFTPNIMFVVCLLLLIVSFFTETSFSSK
ncbi:hypothetical protein M3Y95_00304100 [Aphelenchoides besseyi]|nr:hypothetical protein M3Y95_00304100 [Aphelenchoides besseyi]